MTMTTHNQHPLIGAALTIGKEGRATIQPRSELDHALVVRGYKFILEGLGLDTDDPHFRETAERAAKAMYHELCAGLTKMPPSITTFPHDGTPGMIVLHDIPVRSICAHHLLPFIGKASVGYIPGKGRVLGVSKLSRLVNFRARRPQVQETLTREIAEELWTYVGQDIDEDHEEGAGGVGVVIRANHFCMELRGVNHSGLMETSELMGVFREPEVRAEFLTLAKSRS